MEEEEKRRKERLAEAKFKEWLDTHEIPYWYIKQDKESFSPALKKYLTKRPDFLILVPSIGFIITDVKYKKPAEKYEKFFLNAEEAEKYNNLQKYFGIQIFYVFSSEENHFNTWYWIPTRSVLEIGEKHKSKGSKEEYFSIPMEKFIQVSKNDDMGRVFSGIPKYI